MLAVPRPREEVCGGGGGFWLRLTTASAQCLRLSDRFFIVIVVAYYCTKIVLSSHTSRPSLFTTRPEGHKGVFKALSNCLYAYIHCHSLLVDEMNFLMSRDLLSKTDVIIFLKSTYMTGPSTHFDAWLKRFS